MPQEGQKFMRLLLFFDLPVKTPLNRRHYTRFHKFLIKNGFQMLQLSVYVRLTNGIDNAHNVIGTVRRNLPPEGSIRILTITEKQFRRMEILLGDPAIHEKVITGEQLLLL